MSSERRLAWALHAFPRRFRASRSAEIRATAADAHEHGDDAYGWRAMADIVIAGWRERHRTRPPLRTYLGYRFGGRRLPPRWHAWMLDDVNGWIGLKEGLASLISMVPVIMALVALTGSGPAQVPWHLDALLVLLGVSAATGGFRRRRILRNHGYDADTRQWAPPAVPLAFGPRAVVPARPLLLGTGLGLAMAGPAAAVSMLWPNGWPQSMAIGQWSFSRVVSTTSLLVAGTVALVAAVILLLASIVLRDRLVARLGAPDDLTHVRPTRWTDWLPGPALGVLGTVGCLLPVTPLAVPVVLLVASGAAPALIVLGARAGRLERETGGPVWFRLAQRASVPAT